MNTKEAADKWNLSVDTIRDYCKKKYICGARFMRNKGHGRWYIPDDTMKPFVSRAKKQSAIRKNVLKAIENMNSYNHYSFHCDEKYFRSIIEAIVHDELVTETPAGLIALTEKGIHELHPIKSMNLVKDVVVPLASIPIKILIEKMLGPSPSPYA